MMISSIQEEWWNTINKLDSDWHRILGVEGNYYLGQEENKLMLSLLTYKRICDICEDQFVTVTGSETMDFSRYHEGYLDGLFKYDYRESWSWAYVFSQKNVAVAFEEAVNGINTSNYSNIAYGDKLIPIYRVPQECHAVLLSWSDILAGCRLGEKDLSEDDWLLLSKWLRTRK